MHAGAEMKSRSDEWWHKQQQQQECQGEYVQGRAMGAHVSNALYHKCPARGKFDNSRIRKLFNKLDGFVALRRVRTMCFVDFESKQQATSAIWRTNGYKFNPEDEGILVSYDKDDNEERGGWSMRKREEDKRKRQEIDASRAQYQCSACSHFCLKLDLPLADLPTRKTDGSRVVDTARNLVCLLCAKGGVKLLKREKGTEKQYRYNCELCDLCVGYRSAPYDVETKYIYLFPEALVPKSCKQQSRKNKPFAVRRPLVDEVDSIPGSP